jgi:hypothetical protein
MGTTLTNNYNVRWKATKKSYLDGSKKSHVERRPIQKSGQVGFRSGQGQVMCCLAWPMLDLFLVLDQTELDHASILDVLGLFFVWVRVF